MQSEMTGRTSVGTENRQGRVYYAQPGTQLRKSVYCDGNCTVASVDMKDIETLVKIKGILAKGNNAEVKTGKNGIMVMEVRKTIVE